jgi:hypothetical protein
MIDLVGIYGEILPIEFVYFGLIVVRDVLVVFFAVG